MNASKDTPARQGAQRPPLAVIAVALVITCAGLLALGQSDALTATGRHIKNLEDQRAQLHEQRAEALLRLAAATDPRRLGTRAEALGFRATTAVTYLSVHELPGEAPIGLESSPANPLAILLDSASPAPVRDHGRLVRMMAVAPRTAAASGAHRDEGQ